MPWRPILQDRMFNMLDEFMDFERAIIDAAILPIHRSGQGATEWTEGQSAGNPRSGAAKLPSLADVLGSL